METKKLLEVREFLNLPDSGTVGAIYSSVHYDDWGVAAYLIITDCSHKIELNVDCDTEDQLQNTMYKLNLITKTIQSLKEALVLAHTSYKELQKEEED